MGHLVANKEAQKVFKIQDHIGLTIAGGVGDAQRLVKILKAECALYEIQRGRKISVEGAATLLSNILQNSKFFPYWVQLIMAGYDTEPRLYSLDLAGSLMEEKSVSTGSGSPVAYGVLEDKYKKNRPVKENLPIAARAIKAATERDVYSGGDGIDIASITKSGIKFYKKDDIEALLK